MKNNYITNLFSKLLSFVIFVPVIVLAQGFQHPGAMHTKKDLDFIKGKVNANQEPWKTAYQQFLTLKADRFRIPNEPFTSLSYTHSPFTTVKCGFFNTPNEGCNEIVYDASVAYSLALRFYLSEDKVYADRAIEILMDWSNQFITVEDQNARLIASWTAPWLVNAAEILRYTPNSGWTTTNTNKLNQYLNRLRPLVLWEGNPNNNWRAAAIEARMAIGIFQNDNTYFNNAVNAWKTRIKTYIFQWSDGTKPLIPAGSNLSLTQLVWKHHSDHPNTRYMNGLCMETCRDMNHTKLGIWPFMNAAEMAYNQGIDLFDLEKQRLKDFFELHGGWWLGEAVPSDVCQGSLDWKGTREDSKVAFDLAYNHLHDRLGMSLPKTLQLINQKRPLEGGPWVRKWESLCYANRPFGNTNQDPTGEFLSPTFSSIDEGYDELYIEVDASDPDGDAITLTLFIDNVEIRKESSAPYEWGHIAEDGSNFKAETRGLSTGDHNLKVVIEDGKGGSKTIVKTVTVTEEGVSYLPLLQDAYVQGTNGFDNEDLKIESGNRVSYIKFDLSSVAGLNVVEASLELMVGGDAGAGKLTVHEADHFVWTETTINSSNAPVADVFLDQKNQTYALGQIYSFDVLDADFNEQKVTFILQMPEGGDDVWFASDEHTTMMAPRLRVKVGQVTSLLDTDGTKISVFPNPSEDGLFNLSELVDFEVHDIQGHVITEGNRESINLSNQPRGIYILHIGSKQVKLIH